jgi:hypothetical protein
MTSDLLKLLGEFLEVRTRLNRCCAGSHVASRTFREMESVEARLAEAYQGYRIVEGKRGDMVVPVGSVPPVITSEMVKRALLGCSQMPMGHNVAVRAKDIWPELRRVLEKEGIPTSG